MTDSEGLFDWIAFAGISIVVFFLGGPFAAWLIASVCKALVRIYDAYLYRRS